MAPARLGSVLSGAPCRADSSSRPTGTPQSAAVAAITGSASITLSTGPAGAAGSPDAPGPTRTATGSKAASRRMLAQIRSTRDPMSWGAPGGSIWDGRIRCSAGTQKVARSPAWFSPAATSGSAPAGSLRSHRPRPSAPVLATSAMSAHTSLCGSEVALTAYSAGAAGTSALVVGHPGDRQAEGGELVEGAVIAAFDV